MSLIMMIMTNGLSILLGEKYGNSLKATSHYLIVTKSINTNGIVLIPLLLLTCISSHHLL